MNIIFFGSTSDSVIVLDALHRKFPVDAVVTQRPKPIGRKKIITPTPVETWAKENKIPALTFAQDPGKPWKFAHDEDVINSIKTLQPNLIVTACYGQKIPAELIRSVQHGAVNVHPSLLPRWRGGDPVPWTILAGDAEIGVTIVTLTERFDDGRILAQKKVPVTKKDTSDGLRTKLFTLGAKLLIETLPDYLSEKNKGFAQKPEEATIARRLTRDDGYIPWDEFFAALETNQQLIDRKFRALSGWPGVWTTTPFHKRLKLISLFPTPLVQLEGKNPVDWKTFCTGYFTP